MEITVESGDLLLVSRACSKMDVVSMAICFGAKLVGRTDWDHLGIVVEDPSNGNLYLLEANVSGVTLFPLKDRIERSKASMFAVRKLIGNRDEKYIAALWELAQRYKDKKYNDSFLSMATAAISSVKTTFDELHKVVIDERQLQAKLNIVDHCLESSPALGNRAANGSLDKRLLLVQALQHRKKCLTSKIAEVESKLESLTATYKQQQADANLDANANSAAPKQEKDGYFCSELVAEVLTELNDMAKYRMPYHYIPADFSSSAFVPSVFSISHASEYHFSCDLVMLKSDIESMSIQPGELQIRLSSAADQTWDMNVGDVLPPSITSQIVRQMAPMADETAGTGHSRGGPLRKELVVTGDVHILTPAHPTDHLNTKDAKVLGVLRPKMGSLAGDVLRACHKQYPDIYLQAERRSTLTMRTNQQLAGSESGDVNQLRTQQQAVAIREAWLLSWHDLIDGDSKIGRTLTPFSVENIQMVYKELADVPASRVHPQAHALWTSFLDVLGVQGENSTSSRKRFVFSTNKLKDLHLLYALYELYVLTPDAAHAMELLDLFSCQVKHISENHPSSTSLEEYTRELCDYAMEQRLVFQGNRQHEDSLTKLSLTLPVITTLAWRSRKSTWEGSAAEQRWSAQTAVWSSAARRYSPRTPRLARQWVRAGRTGVAALAVGGLAAILAGHLE